MSITETEPTQTQNVSDEDKSYFEALGTEIIQFSRTHPRARRHGIPSSQFRRMEKAAMTASGVEPSFLEHLR